jgi:ketosteroid isomerase-like protein
MESSSPARDTARAMSQENVEIVRAALDAWNRGDWDEWRTYLSPDFEFDSSSALGEWRGVTRGPDQVLRAIQQFREPWNSVRIEIDELIDAGEHVVARTTGHFVGRDGIEVQAGGAWCWTFRDGVIIRGLFSNEFDEALKAAGLSE